MPRACLINIVYKQLKVWSNYGLNLKTIVFYTFWPFGYLLNARLDLSEGK